MSRVYQGERPAEGLSTVTVDGRPLRRRHDLRNHSISLEWGYEGSGPAQLALALMADHLDHHPEDLPAARQIARIEESDSAGSAEQLALRVYQDFKRHTVGHLPAKWTLTSAEISAVLKEIAGW
jgi:hypothetical protein